MGSPGSMRGIHWPAPGRVDATMWIIYGELDRCFGNDTHTNRPSQWHSHRHSIAMHIIALSIGSVGSESSVLFRPSPGLLLPRTRPLGSFTPIQHPHMTKPIASTASRALKLALAASAVGQF